MRNANELKISKQHKAFTRLSIGRTLHLNTGYSTTHLVTLRYGKKMIRIRIQLVRSLNLGNIHKFSILKVTCGRQYPIL